MGPQKVAMQHWQSWIFLPNAGCWEVYLNCSGLAIKILTHDGHPKTNSETTTFVPHFLNIISQKIGLQVGRVIRNCMEYWLILKPLVFSIHPQYQLWVLALKFVVACHSNLNKPPLAGPAYKNMQINHEYTMISLQIWNIQVWIMLILTYSLNPSSLICHHIPVISNFKYLSPPFI